MSELDAERRAHVKELLLGGLPDGAERADLRADELGQPLLDWTDVAVWDVWTRSGLDIKVRSIVTVVVQVMLNRPALLRKHLRGALRTGNTPVEIREVLLHLAPYIGIPAASEAMAMFLSVLAEVRAAEQVDKR